GESFMTTFRMLVFVSTVVATTVAGSMCMAADLIVNGGFETGDFTGWNLDPTPSFPEYTVGSPVNSGNWAAQIAGYSVQSGIGDGPDALSQDIVTTAGQHYDLTFFRLQTSGGPIVSLDVYWSGNLIFHEYDGGPGDPNNTAPILYDLYQGFS